MTNRRRLQATFTDQALGIGTVSINFYIIIHNLFSFKRHITRLCSKLWNWLPPKSMPFHGASCRGKLFRSRRTASETSFSLSSRRQSSLGACTQVRRLLLFGRLRQGMMGQSSPGFTPPCGKPSRRWPSRQAGPSEALAALRLAPGGEQPFEACREPLSLRN